ncbi:hypothetical protein P389DRAFT_104318 [Cystobasidium minutum MCA 4210]|uniref:uncharacterized protein n=1 Tax=Cystobasidium minutum MCA 4210 TaxID=1397322 RepID=UPI0034CE1C1F|eukprot:jgi/Rhomi1/104318/CE104317_758
MEAHPLFADIAHVCDKYPEQAGSIWQAYLDLKLSQRWEDVEVTDLEVAGICVLRGRNPKQASEEKSVIFPMSLTQSTCMALLELPFSHMEPSHESVFLAIASEDSSIVYYKIARGIVAPKEVKE